MRVVLAFLVAGLVLASSANVMADANGLTSQFIPPAIPRSADGEVSGFSISFTNTTSQPITLTSITLNGCVNVANYPSESGSGTAITNCTQPMLNVPTCIAPGKGFTFTGAPFDQYGAVPSFSTFNATQRPATRADGGAECAAWFYQQSASTSSPSPQAAFNSVITSAPSPSASTPSGVKSATPLPGANAVAAGAAVSNAMSQALANTQAGDKTAATDAFSQMMASAPHMSTGSVAALGAAAGIVDIFNAFSSSSLPDGRVPYDDRRYKADEAVSDAAVKDADDKVAALYNRMTGPAQMPNGIDPNAPGSRFDEPLDFDKALVSIKIGYSPPISAFEHIELYGYWDLERILQYQGCRHELFLTDLDRRYATKIASSHPGVPGNVNMTDFRILGEPDVHPDPSMDDAFEVHTLTHALADALVDCARETSDQILASRRLRLSMVYRRVAIDASRWISASVSTKDEVDAYLATYRAYMEDPARTQYSDVERADAEQEATSMCGTLGKGVGMWYVDYGHLYTDSERNSVCGFLFSGARNP